MFLSTILVEYGIYKHVLHLPEAMLLPAMERGRSNPVSKLLPLLADNFARHDYLHTYVWQTIFGPKHRHHGSPLVTAKFICKSNLQDRHMLSYDEIVDACHIHELEWICMFMNSKVVKAGRRPELYALFLAAVACKPDTMTVQGIAAELATFSVEKRQFAESFPVELHMSKEDVVCDIYATLMSIVDMWSDNDCYSFTQGVSFGNLQVDKLSVTDKLTLHDILTDIPQIKQDVLARKHCQTIENWLKP